VKTYKFAYLSTLLLSCVKIRQETYKMINTCDESIATWATEGDMFVIKDYDAFENKVIPQYFDHNKYSSFARQLNFYGFRKITNETVRRADFDPSTAKWIKFHNKNFVRGRPELLSAIKRTTRANTLLPGQQNELSQIKHDVDRLQFDVDCMKSSFESKFEQLSRNLKKQMKSVESEIESHFPIDDEATKQPARSSDRNKLLQPWSHASVNPSSGNELTIEPLLDIKDTRLMNLRGTSMISLRATSIDSITTDIFGIPDSVGV